MMTVMTTMTDGTRFLQSIASFHTRSIKYILYMLIYHVGCEAFENCRKTVISETQKILGVFGSEIGYSERVPENRKFF